MDNTLLPCPFCGGEANAGTIPVVGGGYIYAFVECLSESCNGSSGHHDTTEEAIAAWNHRADHIRDTTKMVSNADHIRKTTDEELARWLVDATVCERVCGEDKYCHGNECVKRVTDWLKHSP